MNPSISGIGLRIALYLQTLLFGESLLLLISFKASINKFLGWISVLGHDSSEGVSAINSLLVTNFAFILSAFVWGFSSQPMMVLQECVSSMLSELRLLTAALSAIVVLYFLILTWSVSWVSLRAGGVFGGSALRRYFYFVQSVLTFCFAFALLAKGSNFGISSECNELALVVLLFIPMSAVRTARLLGWVLFPTISLVWALDVCPHLTLKKSRSRQRNGRIASAMCFVFGGAAWRVARLFNSVTTRVMLVTVLVSLTAANTELLVHLNYSAQTMSWDFSQVRTILPFPSHCDNDLVTSSDFWTGVRRPPFP